MVSYDIRTIDADGEYPFDCDIDCTGCETVMMKADGFDKAIMGMGQQFDRPERLIYDYQKCVEILMERDGMTEEEGIEFMIYNVIGAYVGKGTPIFMHPYVEELIAEK